MPAFVVEAKTWNAGLVRPFAPMAKVEEAAKVEMTLPLLSTEKSVVVPSEVEDAIAKSVVRLPDAPLGVAMESSAYGEEVPTPRLLLALFQKRLDAPPNELLLLNCICPLEPPGVEPLPPQAEPVVETWPKLLTCKQFVDPLPRPDTTRLVIEAPPLKVWLPLQVLVSVSKVEDAEEPPPPLPVMQVPFKAKQPAVRLMPPVE